MAVRIYRCPACGGEVDEGARTCPYCRSPIATVRCANCFHMNVPEANHCSGCGRELGLEPIGSRGELECPHCRVQLEAFASGPGRLFDCHECGGQFVENALLRELLERRVVYGQVVPRKPRPIPTERVRYVPCPACANLMQRKNFGRSSGVIVDVCTQHGIWFDVGELPAVIAFVENGGLQRDALRREEEARVARQHASISLPPSSSSDPRLATVDLEDLRDAASALLGYLKSLV